MKDAAKEIKYPMIDPQACRSSSCNFKHKSEQSFKMTWQKPKAQNTTGVRNSLVFDSECWYNQFTLTCMRSFTLSNGAVTVFAAAPATAPAKNKANSLGTKLTRARGFFNSLSKPGTPGTLKLASTCSLSLPATYATFADDAPWNVDMLDRRLLNSELEKHAVNSHQKLLPASTCNHLLNSEAHKAQDSIVCVLMSTVH